MSYRVVVIYASVSGNTYTLAQMIYDSLLEENLVADMLPINQLTMVDLQKYDMILIGSYTWGSGEIPKDMLPLYKKFEKGELTRSVTGVFGTGDKCYPYYCGAVDLFRDMLHVHSNLAVTLKIELMPQQKDKENCKRFVEKVLQRVKVRY
ncbi:flavodoxin domain-containing protein [Bacillus sp. DJP31]|uniref:flavodoxin domain-containing protein n=1 Tax=Bacillus sp. DJP31 TaxID=3409789 RepID=UPI003BB70CAF